MNAKISTAIPLLLLASACGSPAALEPALPEATPAAEVIEQEDSLASSEASLCLKAAEHLQSCLDMETPQMPGYCDPELAKWTLAQSCDVLNSDPATYGWGWSWNWLERLACNLGWVYYCKPEGCTRDQPLNACVDYRDLEGCQKCEYYSFLEAEKGLDCGSTGYFQGYGQKYCSRFSAITENFMSLAGRQWMANVRVCLMSELETIVDNTDNCGDIRRGAFDSHAGCYVDSGLCSLPPSDWAHIVATISPWDNDLKQVILSGAGCLQEWLGRSP